MLLVISILLIVIIILLFSFSCYFIVGIYHFNLFYLKVTPSTREDNFIIIGPKFKCFIIMFEYYFFFTFAVLSQVIYSDTKFIWLCNWVTLVVPLYNYVKTFN